MSEREFAGGLSCGGEWAIEATNGTATDAGQVDLERIRRAVARSFMPSVKIPTAKV